MSEVSSSKKRASKGRRGVLVSVLVMVAVVVFGLTAPPTGAQYHETPTCRLSSTIGRHGDRVTVYASGFGPGTVVHFTLFSDPIPLGEAVVDARGETSLEFTIPAGVPLGTHEVEASGELADGTPASVRATLEVVADDAGAGGTDGVGDDDLARTGSNATTLVRIAVLLIAAGGAALLATRKRAQRGAPSV